MSDRTKPYNYLPEVPPKTDLNESGILRQAIKSNKALAELKGVARATPNQTILINSLPLLEAQTSSEIENVLTQPIYFMKQLYLKQIITIRKQRKFCVIAKLCGMVSIN